MTVGTPLSWLSKESGHMKCQHIFLIYECQLSGCHTKVVIKQINKFCSRKRLNKLNLKIQLFNKNDRVTKRLAAGVGFQI